MQDHLDSDLLFAGTEFGIFFTINGDVPFPGWDTLLKERREEAPQILLTVMDSGGNVIRRLSGPSTKGFHRVAWDLRYPLRLKRILELELPRLEEALESSGAPWTPGRAIP